MLHSCQNKQTSRCSEILVISETRSLQMKKTKNYAEKSEMLSMNNKKSTQLKAVIKYFQNYQLSFPMRDALFHSRWTDSPEQSLTVV